MVHDRRLNPAHLAGWSPIRSPHGRPLSLAARLVQPLSVWNRFPHKYSLTAHFLSNAEVSNTKQTNFGPFFSPFWTNRYPHYSWFWCFLSGEREYSAHFPAWLSTKKELTKNQKITSLVVLTQLLTDFSMAKPNLHIHQHDIGALVTGFDDMSKSKSSPLGIRSISVLQDCFTSA